MARSEVARGESERRSSLVRMHQSYPNERTNFQWQTHEADDIPWFSAQGSTASDDSGKDSMGRSGSIERVTIVNAFF